MKKRHLLLSALGIIFFLNSFAQTIIRHSHYVYLYKLSINEAVKLKTVKNLIPDSTFFHTPYDSFPEKLDYTRTPPPGYYMAVKAFRQEIQYTLIQVSSLETRIINNGEDLGIRILRKKTGEEVKNARVSCGSAAFTYDESASCFMLKGRHKTASVRIEAEGETLFLEVTGKTNTKSTHESENYTGYVAFSKPRYRLGDTVKLKAFIQYKGKPLTETLQVRVPKNYYDTYPSKTIFKTDLNPVSPGAYVCSFVAGDSMLVDMRYTVNFYRRKGSKESNYKKIFFSDFRTEDYQLDQTRYSVKTLKPEYHPGDTVSIILSGTDFNGLPLFDAKAHIRVETSNILDPASDTEDYTYEVYHQDMTLDPSGETRLEIPPSAFSKSGMGYSVTAEFTNSNGELHTESVFFSIVQEENSIQVEDQDSVLLARYYEHGKEVKSEGQVTYLSSSEDSILIKPIAFPYSFSPLPLSGNCYLKCKGTGKNYYYPNDKIEVKGYRTNDSVSITLSNPRKIPVNWELRKEGNLIKKGSSRSFNYYEKDPGRTSYSIQIRYEWGNQNEVLTKNILPKTNTLNVELVQDKEVYPGQKGQVTLKVSDYDHKPVKDANLTAACVNSQFGNEQIPGLPDFNPKKELKKKEYFIYRSSTHTYYTGTGITTYWLRKMHLDSMYYYHLLFPGNAIYTNYFPSKTEDAQFAPYVISNSGFQKIWFMYVDDKAVYADTKDPMQTWRYSRDDTPWSFILPAGKHTLRLRTLNREYEIKDIELKPGYKLELSFDADHPPAAVAVKKRKKKLSPQELEVLNKQAFVFRQVSGQYTGHNFFVQGKNIRALSEGYVTLFHPGDTLHYKVYTQTKVKTGSFLFASGTAYYFNDNGVKGAPVIFKKKKLSGSGWDSYTPGQFALTKEDVYSTNLHYGYYWGSQGIPALSYSSDTTNGTYLFDYTGKEHISSVEFYSGESNAVMILYPGDNHYSGSGHFLYNLVPGSYKAVFRSDEGAYSKRTISIQKNKLHFERIRHMEFLPVDRDKPLPVTCPAYSLEYKKQSYGILGQVKGPVNLKGIQVSVWTKGSIIGIVNTDTTGHFEAEVREAGIYDLFIGNDTLYKDIWIGGLIVSKNYSALLTIILTGRKESAPVYISYNFSAQGRNLKMNPQDSVRNASVSVSFSPAKEGAPRMKNFFSDLARGETNWQVETDDPGFLVDDASLPPQYRYHRRRRFRRVRSSSFYRSHYSTAGGAFFKAKKRELSTGWNFGDSKTGERWEDVRFLDGDGRGPGASHGYHAQTYYYPNGTTQINGDWDKDGISDKSDYALHFSPGAFDTIKKLALNPIPQKQLRKTFNDNAYWQPNLLTDEKGMASFAITFPDNITRWDAFALAMTGQKQSGKALFSTKSYKPLIATLSVPRFLLTGDSAFAVGKVMNYGPGDAALNTSFLFGNKTLKTTKHTVSKGLNEKQLLTATGADTLKLEYNLETAGGYSDGEEQIIPVFPKGSEEATGTFWYLPRDSSFTVSADTSGLNEITVLGNDLDLLLAKLKTIRDYPYFCNEQMASKLNALLMEKSIFEKRGLTFRGEKEVNRLIHKLEKAQNLKGGWGWWDDSQTVNVFMTAYVTHALGKAVRTGYSSPAFNKGIEALKFELPGLTGNELVYVMSVLSENKALPDPSRYISETGKKANLSTWAKYTLVHIRQENGLDAGTEVRKILADKKETVLGACYWGDVSTEWYDNSTQLSLIAYKILEKQGGQEKTLEGIRCYFLEHSDRNVFRNTYESASILETILPYKLASFKEGTVKSTLAIKGGLNRTIDHFPYTGSFKPTSTELGVSKKGNSPLYFSVYHRSWNPAPEKKEELYTVKTHFESEGKEITNLHFGKVTTLVAEVKAVKKGDYIMIEIPVPAGCSYNDKKKSYSNYEVHREYFKNKVLIFCESMPVGTWRFEVELQPRYTGSYTLNPAKTELMYFPFLYGRTEIKRIKIGE